MEKFTDIEAVFWIGTTFMFFVAFGLIFLALYYQNRLMLFKKEEAEHLLIVSLDSESKERKRIAADLHDGVTGDLSAIRNYITILKKKDSNSEGDDILNEIKNGVDSALDAVRTISHNLMPPLLESHGLGSALKKYFETLSNKCTIKFYVHSEHIVSLNQEVSYELYRIVQEFTNNLLKYSDASKFEVSIKSNEQYFIVDLNDNGRRYRFDELLKISEGSGLKNIATRLKVLQAIFLQQESELGNHFTITIKRK